MSHWKKVQRAFSSAKSIIFVNDTLDRNSRRKWSPAKTTVVFILPHDPYYHEHNLLRKRRMFGAKMTISVIPETVQTNEIFSPRELDNLIIWTPCFSSIIFYYFSHLTWWCLPPDSALKVITATPKQQIFHTSRYLCMFSTYKSVFHTWG